MITKFGTLFAGHVDMEPVGLAALQRSTSSLYPNDHLITAFDRSVDMAKLMDDLGLRHPVARRTPLPARGLRVHPQYPDAGNAPDQYHQEA